MSETTTSTATASTAKKRFPTWALIVGALVVVVALIAVIAINTVAAGRNPNRDVAQQDKEHAASQITLNKYMGLKPVAQSRVVKQEPLRELTDAKKNHSYLQAVYAGDYKELLTKPLAELKKIGFHCDNEVSPPTRGWVSNQNIGSKSLASN